jgi:hypothetical protein
MLKKYIKHNNIKALKNELQIIEDQKKEELKSLKLYLKTL